LQPELNWRIVALSKGHERASFQCGVESLDRYFHRQALQDLERHVAATFVLELLESERIGGYYSLAATGVPRELLPTHVAQKLPKYPLLPATLLGRLAVSLAFRGRGLGEHLLLDALRRSWELSGQIGSIAVVVDAIDETARAFYERYGFIGFADARSRLVLPMATIAKLFR
jgi:GNAT superfamily N-acetyltransferase